MADAGLVQEPSEQPHATPNTSPNVPTPVSPARLKCLIDDDNYKILQRHFLMVGKGRRPDLALAVTLTNGLLVQLFFVKEEAKSSFAELKMWLEKLLPGTSHVSESRIYHRINTIVDLCAGLSQEEATVFLQSKYDFDALPPPLASLGINRQNINAPESFCQSPLDDICNEVVVALSRENKSPTFIRQWLIKLSLSCRELSESKLRTLISKTMKKYQQLTKNKKGNKLEEFLKSSFVERNTNENIDHVEKSVQPVGCDSCFQKDKFLEDQSIALNEKNNFIASLRHDMQEVKAELELKAEVVTEIQKDKAELLIEIQSLKSSVVNVPTLKKQVKQLEKDLNEISNTKLYYRKNSELKKEKDALQEKVKSLEQKLLIEQNNNTRLKKKIKLEQDMKNKYKKRIGVLTDEKTQYIEALHADKEEEEIRLIQKEDKYTMYADNVRQLYMALQGEANVAASQATKVVMLVAKYLFNKDFKMHELPCAKTCLNFMEEANHIAKQQVVSRIRESEHFTYATDGTSREKRHYMEHHLVLNDGSTLSVGFSEVADDKADTLLEKSLDLFDELTDVHCQVNDSVDRNEIFKCILTKMMSLMSDRAANMKSFNKKMLGFKQDLLGSDARIHFLYCNAHFLIGLAEETSKAVRKTETSLEETSGTRLGRDNNAAFKTWSRDETSASRLIRTASDVFGPRGDEKSGCREEWLAHCDTCQVKSRFTSYRSNRFNNLFENAEAILFHRSDALHFLMNRVSHWNLKLKSISCDFQDDRILSIVGAIALLSAYLTSPYWAMMNSKVPYGEFPSHVRAMRAALMRWSSDDFSIQELKDEGPIFGQEFPPTSTVVDSFIESGHCNANLMSDMFKDIAKQCLVVLDRQLADFLSEGIYGSTLSPEVKDVLDCCPLTNLAGERLFGDLDYDMTKRRTASTFLRSTLNMWKHNRTSKFLDEKTPKSFKKAMASGRKHGKELKRKHKEVVERVRERIKAKILDNEREKNEKDLQNKEKQSALLSDILSQGGLCESKDDLDRLLKNPNALQNLKAQIRFRKQFMGAQELRLTGNFNTLLTGLCHHLGIEYDNMLKPIRKRRRVCDDYEERKEEDEVETSSEEEFCEDNDFESESEVGLSQTDTDEDL